MTKQSKISGTLLTAMVLWGLPGPSLQAAPFTVTLTGQTMIQSDFRTQSPALTATMRPLLKGDAVFTNFESTIARNGEPNAATPLKGVGIHAPPGAFDALAGMGFNLLSFANNHSWDMGAQGILNEVSEADLRGLAHAGAGATLKEAAAPAYLQTRHGVVGLVALASGLIAPGASATATRAGVNELRLEPGNIPNDEDSRRVLASIREARAKSSFVIVYQHNHVFDKDFIEMFRKNMPERFVPPEWLKHWAHLEIDSGADLVVMHGAPLLHGIEIYKGHAIFYDLGNYMFNLDHIMDDIFNQDTEWQSVIASARFDGKTLKSISLRPIVLNKRGEGSDPLFIQTRGLPAPAKGDQAHAILAGLADASKRFGTVITIKGDVGEIKPN